MNVVELLSNDWLEVLSEVEIRVVTNLEVVVFWKITLIVIFSQFSLIIDMYLLCFFYLFDTSRFLLAVKRCLTQRISGFVF